MNQQPSCQPRAKPAPASSSRVKAGRHRCHPLNLDAITYLQRVTQCRRGAYHTPISPDLLNIAHATRAAHNGIPERAVTVKCGLGRVGSSRSSGSGWTCLVGLVGVRCDGSRGPCSGHPGEGEANLGSVAWTSLRHAPQGWWHGALRPQSDWAQSHKSTRPVGGHADTRARSLTVPEPHPACCRHRISPSRSP